MNGLSYRYCTGGIRCEMASAYIRSLGDGFDNVFQVSSCIKFEFLRFPCEQKMGYPFLSVERNFVESSKIQLVSSFISILIQSRRN